MLGLTYAEGPLGLAGIPPTPTAAVGLGFLFFLLIFFCTSFLFLSLFISFIYFLLLLFNYFFSFLYFFFNYFFILLVK